jgi:hypothetical protein
VFDDDRIEPANLNRNMLNRRSDGGKLKVRVIVDRAPSGVMLAPMPQRFVAATSLQSAARVIVGVDDIPSRWTVQRTNAPWIGVAGTSHFGVSCSSHVERQPCAGCLHPRDDPADGPIPTISFVSFWAGLCLAVRLVRDVLGFPYAASQQHLWLWPLRMDAPERAWSPVAAREDCPVRCAASQRAAVAPP